MSGSGSRPFLEKSDPGLDVGCDHQQGGAGNANAVSFAHLMHDFKRVVSEAHTVGSGLEAAISVFFEQVSDLPKNSAYGRIHTLCQRKCYRIKRLRLTGRAKQWYNDHPFVARAISVAEQIKGDPQTYSIEELEEVFLRARFLVSAKTMDTPICVHRWWFCVFKGSQRGMIREKTYFYLNLVPACSVIQEYEDYEQMVRIRYQGGMYPPWALDCSSNDLGFRQIATPISVRGVLLSTQQLFEGFDNLPCTGNHHPS